MRLLELQNESDSLQACRTAGVAAPTADLRGWAALVPPDLAEPAREEGLTVLRGSTAVMFIGTLSQLREVARERVAAVESPQPWRLPRARLPERPLVMGIVNVTPDSFSDGGRFLDVRAAVEHGLRLVQEGADLLDVGGESTRPGAEPVSEAEERFRIEPVVRELAARSGVPVSIDTSKRDVAAAALDAGAQVVNDASGLSDGRLASLVASRDAALIVMHTRGTPADMQSRAVYRDVHGEVLAELDSMLARARDAGIAQERIAVDPGLGFAKTAGHNLLLLRRQRELLQLGRPLVVGASRKSFLGKLDGRPPAERLISSVACAALCVSNGAMVIRAHDVRETREAVLVAHAIRQSQPSNS
ncbi:MAG: dihydropteroate synthase [Myxococcales bacterium]